MHWRVGAFIVFLAGASGVQATPERRQESYYGMNNGTSTSTSQDELTVVEYATETLETSVTISDSVSPSAYAASSSSISSASDYFAASPSGSSAAPAVTEVSEVTTYLTVSASEYSTPSAYSSASPSNYAPSPVGPATGSENRTFSYEPTTTTVQTAPVITTTTTATANATCGGATLNVLDASLDWWYAQTYSYAVSTLSLLFDANDSQTGWTLLPATTTFNITTALAAETCTPSPEYDTYINKTITAYDCFSTPVPVAASTTIIEVNAVKSINATTGNGTNYPDIATTAPPAIVTIPSSAGSFAAGTPFVFFSAYEIESKRPTTYANGSEGCATTTRVYNMTKPFGFEYDGPDVNGSLLVGQDAVGDVNPAFLNVVNQTYATAGSWVAAPTVAVVVERVVVAQAVLAAHTEISATELETPTPTLPPFVSLISPTAESQTLAVPSPRIESSAAQLQVPDSTPTTHRNFIGPMTFIAHLEHSDTTLILPEPTDVSSFMTSVGGETVTAFAEGDVPPRTSPTSTKSDQTVKPFVAHLESSNVVLDVPVPATQTVVTAVKDGQTYTATALSAVETQGAGQSNDDNNGGGAGYGGLIGAIVSAAQPTNALQVLSAALGQEHGNPTASAILAGLGGSAAGGAVAGSASNGGSGAGPNAQPDQLPASPAQVLTYNGAAVTASPMSAYVVDGQTAFAGGAPITVSGTVVSVPASTNAIVVGGSTMQLSGSSSVFDTNGMTITADAVQAYPIAGQTLQPGGQAITVNGHTLSLMPGAGALVVDGSTSSMATGGGDASSIPLLTVGSRTYTANAATQYYFGAGETLTPGGSVVVSGTTISLGSDASALVINGQTQTLSPPLITAGPMINVAGSMYAPNAADAYNINGQMLTPGGVIVVSGTTMSLASDGSAVVINGQTSTLSGSGGASNTAATTAPAVLTIDGQAFAPNAGSSYLISGQTLTPGGQITFSGANGMETISLDSSGSMMVEAMNGHTMTSTLAGEGDIAPTAAPILTIGDQTFTALPGSGTSYVIDGQTLTPGGVETLTVAGHTYIVSLSPQATVLEVEIEGSGGEVTATSFETLFPATNTRATVYMTASGSGSDRAQQTGSSASGGATSTGAGAGLQSAAAPMLSVLPMTSAVMAVGTLVLAIWL